MVLFSFISKYFLISPLISSLIHGLFRSVFFNFHIFYKYSSMISFFFFSFLALILSQWILFFTILNLNVFTFNWRVMTKLYWFLPPIDVNQPQVYACPRPAPHPAEHSAALRAFQSSFPLTICFTHGIAQVSELLSACPTFSFPAVPTVCSPCLSFYPFPAGRFISTIFLDCI